MKRNRRRGRSRKQNKKEEATGEEKVILGRPLKQYTFLTVNVKKEERRRKKERKG